MTKQKTIDMTEGSLLKNILFFSLPLMLTQMLEVLFNLSDIAIAGKYANYIALGAVGSTTLLVSLFTGILIGVGSGVNVRVAHRLGAQKADGDTSATARTIYTAFAVCGVIGIIVCLVCGIFARPMLEALNTKDELIDGAVLYLHIYSLGMPAMALYNFGNGVLSACGDTKRPLVYLSAAGVLNVLLNLFFVIVCKMAADGVALASVIAQYVSAGLILRRLLTTDDSCRLRLSHRLFDKKACKGVLMIGIPTGMQNAIFAVANLFVQTGVNHFDAIMVSGNSAAANADTLIFNVMSAFYTACASFISRNHGAGKNDRIMKTYGISLAYSFAAGAVFGGSLLLFGRQFLSLFTNEPRVVEAGMQRVMIMGRSYCISAFMDCTIAASRGIGRSVVPTVIVIMGSCVFRVIWVYTVFAHFMTIPSLYLLYSFSWAITAAAEIAYFMHSYKKFIKAPQAEV